MRPKERKKQKQSSRLYLRRKDHRECIMNDTYHNAIWLKKTKDDGTVQDELAWIKYPNRHMLFYTRFYYGYYSAVFGYFDIDRQFAFGTNHSGSTSIKAIALEDYVVVVRTYSTTDILISENGISYKQYSFSNGRHGMQRFGENALVYWWQNGTTLGYTTMDLVDFGTDDFKINEVTHYSTTVQGSSPYYVCETEEGCIVAYNDSSSSGYTLILYELTRAGAIRLTPVTIPNVHDFIESGKSGAKGDGFYCLCSCEVWRNNISVPFKFDFCVYWSNDKTTWNKTILYSSENWDSSSNKGMFCVNRGLYTYFYCRENGNMRIFKTMTGGAFTEVETNKALIVGAINSGGLGVANSGYNTVQIALKNDAYPSADVQLSCNSIDFSTMKNGWCDCYFEDGKLEKHKGFLTFMISQGSGSSTHYNQVILDNNEFQASEDNVFFRHGGYDTPSGTKYADKVINGDYVLGNTTKESEV